MLTSCYPLIKFTSLRTINRYLEVPANVFPIYQDLLYNRFSSRSDFFIDGLYERRDLVGIMQRCAVSFFVRNS